MASTQRASSAPQPRLPANYKILTKILTTIPSVDTYMQLRHVSGLSAKSVAAARLGLPNSIHSVQIQYIPNDAIVGMGRIIGDGGLFFQTVDMAVDPAHQGKGLGKAIMDELMRWCRDETIEGAYVSLVADGEAKRLYAQFGFEDVGPTSLGMAWSRERKNEGS